MAGQRALAFGGEQTFVAQLAFQRLEGQAQRAIAGRFDAVQNQLIVAASLEQRDLATHPYGQPVAQRLAHAQGVLAEQRAAHLGLAVLEGEIHVAGSGPGQVGDLAFHPHLGEDILQQQAGTVVELTDAQHLAVEVEPFEGIIAHGGDDT